MISHVTLRSVIRLKKLFFLSVQRLHFETSLFFTLDIISKLVSCQPAAADLSKTRVSPSRLEKVEELELQIFLLF